jgi:hypothetical protein
MLPRAAQGPSNEGEHMESMTRRTLLRGAGTVAAAVPLAVAFPVDQASAATRLNRSAFLNAKSAAFRMRGRWHGTQLTLLRVEDLAFSASGDPVRFSLVLRATRGRKPGPGTYSFWNARLGVFNMFVTPVGQGSDLQAVFNAR